MKDRIINAIFIVVILAELVLLSMSSVEKFKLIEQISDNEKEYRYYDDIDFWNEMWTECEFGEQNYQIIRNEYDRG